MSSDPSTLPLLGDMDPVAFHEAATAIAGWIQSYLSTPERWAVSPCVAPGSVRAAFPSNAPEDGESIAQILDDFQRILMPAMTHWNHPGFLAYFASSGSGPGILAEFLTAALNQQAMLWHTSPAATELEAVALSWLRRLLGLPDGFEGVIYDGGSSSNLHALIAAREAAVSEVRSRGLLDRPDLRAVRIYCSEQAHISIDKAAIVLGFGRNAVRKIPTDTEYRLRPDLLDRAIADDQAAGTLPIAVVATVGTTGTGSVDPVRRIAEICRTRGVWLHVDAAYGGAAAMLPEHQWIFEGAASADSIMVNPHKWLFTPLDISAFYTRRIDVLRRALSVASEYLETRGPKAEHNLMDTGIALGRSFRALKLWMVLSYFGAHGIRARLSEHVRLARLFTAWVDGHPEFERLAPTRLSVVCFRAVPVGMPAEELDALNASLLDRVNRSGQVFLSHTRLAGRFAIRLAVGHIRTTEIQVASAWELLCRHLVELVGSAKSNREDRGTDDGLRNR